MQIFKKPNLPILCDDPLALYFRLLGEVSAHTQQLFSLLRQLLNKSTERFQRISIHDRLDLQSALAFSRLLANALQALVYCRKFPQGTRQGDLLDR